MLLEVFFSLCLGVLHWLFVLIPDIPNFNVTILEDLTGFINLIFDNLSLLGFFFDIEMMKLMIPLIIIVINFEHVYHLAIWVLKKVPMLNIK
mgnify:CR=1 FL=1